MSVCTELRKQGLSYLDIAEKTGLTESQVNYYLHTERRLEYQRKYQRQYRRDHPDLMRHYRADNPEKHRARKLAQKRILLASCCQFILENGEICGSKENLGRHHPNYENPLDVITGCSKCHGKETRKNSEA